MKKFLLNTGLVVIAITGANAAQAVTITFEELPTQQLDDLSFMGVTFDFQIDGMDSTDANFGAVGPEAITFVQDPSIEGNAEGILTLEFEDLISTLEFGVALNTFEPLIPGFTVELFDSSLTSLGITSVNTSPLVSFTEALFSFSGEPVKRAVLDFNEVDIFATTTFLDVGARFALDNLTFESAESVPEPSSLLGILALCALGTGAKLQKKRQENDL